MKALEAEMVTMDGTIFGKLVINSNCLSFRSEPRREGRKYRFGSPTFIQIAKDLNKKWKLTDVREVVVKRYNLIRQAVEVYFYSSKSVFFSFYSKAYLQSFIKRLDSIIRKNKALSTIEVVVRPEKYFEYKKFRESWASGRISNFEYLMLLNKYGGRSFNDINQYPIFPWIISNYNSEIIDIDDPKNHRELFLSMGAITPQKQKQADDKLSVLKNEKDFVPYQLGTHCMPGRTVLGYLFRVEPFSSILMLFEQGRDAPSRMFHAIRRAWVSGTTDSTDNKELIPEFYYLPEMFVNHNKYSYGAKFPDDDVLEWVKNAYVKVRVDQVLMPRWARSEHHYVKTNALALESRQASLGLDQWVDLIFGERQQDPRFHNMYKSWCDEEFVAKNLERLTDSNIAEIQEFGSNPIKLFRTKHPVRNQRTIEIRTQYGIFKNLLSKIPATGEAAVCVFAFMKIASFPSEPVTYVKAYGQKMYVVLNTRKLYRSAEEGLNMMHEGPVRFEEHELKMCPYKRVYLADVSVFIGDPARVFDFLEQGSVLVTCRHYDNSCKIVSTVTGEPQIQIAFHRVRLILHML